MSKNQSLKVSPYRNNFHIIYDTWTVEPPLIICKHFFKLLLHIFAVNFAFNVDNVKTIYSTFSLTTLVEAISNYGQELFISASLKPKNTKLLHYILGKYLILLLTSFTASRLCKNRVLNFTKSLYSIYVISLFLQRSKQFN